MPIQRSRLAQAVLAASMTGVLAGAALPALAAEENRVEEIVVQGSLRSLPGENVESIFGFGKSLLETPRSASTISSDQIERFAITDIDQLVVLAPGTFTQSFFGVAGSLDIRGTPGETYFRGVRRLDNPGNYPTPIGASDRIDIVRGPASPIMGPSKIGGYMNFVPKSARAGGGQYLADTEGAVSYTAGSFEKSVITAEVGGPATVAGQDLGYYLYAEVENSDSFYQNSATDQTILQASFDMDLSDNLRIEFGGMYHDYEGNQIAGWNRLTQDLVDNGTYVTGNPFPLDTDGDGLISHVEYDNGGGYNPFTPFIVAGSDATLDDLLIFGDVSLLALDPTTVGTAKLDRDQVLVAADDTLQNEVTTLYFDTIYTTDGDIQIKNQLFYESYDNLNENAYGFSQFHDSWVVEDKLVISGLWTGGGFETQWAISPSLRYTDFEHGDDFDNEYFDRRDLTGPSTALDRRQLSTRINREYTTYSQGDYLNFGIAALVDIEHESGLAGTFGWRWDTIEMDSTQPGVFVRSGETVKADDTRNGVSWSASISYGTPIGLRPYITASEQSTTIAGQGAEIDPGTIAAGGAFDTSELLEAGVKGSFLEDTLYFALSYYEQERTDFSAQSIVTNQSTKTEGWEFETRWVVTEQLLVTAGYSNIEVINLNTEQNGGRFSFIGSDDLPNVAPELLYGGTLGGIVQLGNRSAQRAGTPENILSATATYDFLNGLALNASAVYVEEVDASFSGSVELPDYTLLNLGAVYETDNWLFSLTVNNVTDEDYFRANFPNLFGGQIVLPELPRNYSARAQYRF
ncbi:MAG TPA: TonB-dependent receptor [Pseudomonadales bacterium]|nr:TonB-dependent receptor [Pseudomonadales bacterium]